MPEAVDLSQQQTKSKTIELDDFHLVDELNAPLVAARPKPRGLLPVPPEVEAAVAEDVHRSGIWSLLLWCPTCFFLGILIIILTH